MDQNLQKTIEAAKELFPHMESDEALIEAIFRQCGRNMEVTIDNLIEINNNNNVESITLSQSNKSNSDLSGSAAKVTFKQNGKRPWSDAYINLPDNFLRLTDEDDFAIIMLQNEEFLNELRFNQEFLKTLEQEGAKSQDESFEDRLKHMGKMGKKKYNQLAKLFSFQRNKKSDHKNKSGGKQPLCNDE